MAKRVPDLNGYLGEGTWFEGEITFPDSLRIEGGFRGKILSPEGSLIVSSTGRVEADVEVAEIYIAGKVSGTVRASRRLEISSEGKVEGEVYSCNLIVRDGAVIEGECHMEPPPDRELRGDPEQRKLPDEAREEGDASVPEDAPPQATEEDAEEDGSEKGPAEETAAVWRRPGWTPKDEDEADQAEEED